MPAKEIPEILISAAGWKTAEDFYAAFLAGVGAPEWHGHNLDALWDSIVTGSINRIEPPYRVRITGVGKLPEECRQIVDKFAALIREARAEGAEVEFVSEP
jgi:RNAse (barnase) inhibitor barstar